ncbi:hypothetical protein F2Q70_00035662 [Brassica cretica]|uniref:Uncharacterized protein n=1 Tax=Brassica cretica TaxID=69181 RepID=A0A8S9GB33_BRACR|nr:hypothetical protein F2Q68_00030872 [Brassica cretica]KAF2587015.1 hypothetical protein F2Q70_00035662 [Brassica cretica]
MAPSPSWMHASVLVRMFRLIDRVKKAYNRSCLGGGSFSESLHVAWGLSHQDFVLTCSLCVPRFIQRSRKIESSSTDFGGSTRKDGPGPRSVEIFLNWPSATVLASALTAETFAAGVWLTSSLAVVPSRVC